MMTVKWWGAAGRRAVRTTAQTAVALIGTAALGLLEVDWVAVASGSVLAGVVSLLTSLSGLPELDDGEA
ncbi:holin [Cellulomonas composti]|nr:holin [Cellulomonas composti]